MRDDLGDVLLAEAEQPYERGAALTALMCWPEDEARFDKLRNELCYLAIRRLVAASPGSERRALPLRPAHVFLDKPITEVPRTARTRLERYLEVAEMVTPLFRGIAAETVAGRAVPATPAQERMADAWNAGKDRATTIEAGNFAERVLRPALPMLHYGVAAIHLMRESEDAGRQLTWLDFLGDEAIIASWIALATFIEPLVPIAFPNARDRIIRVRRPDRGFINKLNFTLRLFSRMS